MGEFGAHRNVDIRTFRGFQISRLMLGAAQFGYHYGIANRTGQPSYESVRYMVARAFEEGINALDTSASYIESEEVLGRVLRELRLRQRVFVCTKVPWISGQPGLTPKAVDNFVRSSVLSSLKRLQLEHVPLCLFHRAEDLPYLDALLTLKSKGLIHLAGVSVYTPDEAFRAMELGGIDAIQCPTSVLDQRFIRTGILERAHEQGIAIFARGVYLQGLLFLSHDEMPPSLRELPQLRTAIAELSQLSGQLDIPLAHLALRFVMSLERVTSLIIGMELPAQLESNLCGFVMGNLPQQLVRTLQSQIPDLPENVLNPTLWSRAEL